MHYDSRHPTTPIMTAGISRTSPTTKISPLPDSQSSQRTHPQRQALTTSQHQQQVSLQIIAKTSELQTPKALRHLSPLQRGGGTETTGTTGPHWTYKVTETKPSQSSTPTTIMAHSNPQPPHALNEQYNDFRQQVAAEPITHHIVTSTFHPPQGHAYEADEDLDMDAQLENVSPECGGSSL